ncbi:MAG: VWA domain-containing protein [Chthoniobacterales bacterium]|nr:VWA domain-containing protein [Chthoniobacterales bacterium]
MKNNYAEIAFVLDRSGSMNICRDAAIEGFNRFLKEQQQVEGLAKLTLVLFDDEYLVPVNALPVAEVVPLDEETYVPRGSTALLDAIGRTIKELGTRLAALPESDRPAQVIVAILTDGEENSSHNYTWHQLAAAIKRQTEEYRWTFLFLGANQDAIATAAKMNIAAANAASYVQDGPGLRASSRTFARKMKALRSFSMGNPTIEESHDAHAPLSDMIAEEDAKERS